MDFKYCLIVSQYYHSRHMFIVHIDKDFVETARKFTTEMAQYKRSVEDLRDIHLGDLDPKWCGDVNEIRPRYNVNDAGDIYFINTVSVNLCMHEAFKYREDSRREAAGFKRKSVLEQIDEHHRYSKVQELVEKYFVIA